jgi:hypothetical protein
MLASVEQRIAGRSNPMNNPLLNEMVAKARQDDLRREAERVREERLLVARTSERPAHRSERRRIRLERALALLASIITPW